MHRFWDIRLQKCRDLDTSIVDLTRRCKPLVFAFYICCFVLVNKHIIYLWCNISWDGSSSSFECRIRSRDPGHADLGVILWSGHSGVRHLCLCQILGRYLYLFQSYKGVPKFRNLDSWPRPRSGPVAARVRHLWLCKIWSRYLYSFQSYKGVPKFRDLVTWPRPRPLWGRFMIRTQYRGPSSVSVPNLNQLSLFLQKLLGESQN